jgi:hypothetical protein
MIEIDFQNESHFSLLNDEELNIFHQWMKGCNMDGVDTSNDHKRFWLLNGYGLIISTFERWKLDENIAHIKFFKNIVTQ